MTVPKNVDKISKSDKIKQKLKLFKPYGYT